MNKNIYYKFMFLSAAIWNWIIGVYYIFSSNLLFVLYPTVDSVFNPPSLIWINFFCGFLVIFGIGYYLVSRNIKSNQGIVIMGILVHILVFSVYLIYVFLGDLDFLALHPIGDLVFGILFIEFLLRGKKKVE